MSTRYDIITGRSPKASETGIISSEGCIEMLDPFEIKLGSVVHHSKTGIPIGVVVHNSWQNGQYYTHILLEGDIQSL